MRSLVVSAVCCALLCALAAAVPAKPADVHSMVLKHLNALPVYAAMAAKKVEEVQMTGQRHLLLQTCARMTEERDGELAQLKDFPDIMPAACNKYLESHGVKVIDLDTCPNATVNSGNITGLGDGGCCDKDSQCASGVCDKSTRSCTLECPLSAASDNCASHHVGWSGESFCELISLDPTPPDACTFCHMTYECGTFGSVDNFCMQCPTYIGEVTSDLLETANCQESNSIDDFTDDLSNPASDAVFDDEGDCVAVAGQALELRCDYGWLNECIYPALENLNILLGPDCLDFPCGLVDLEFVKSANNFACLGNGDGEYCAAIMECALAAGVDAAVDNCTFAQEAGCCTNSWITAYEQSGDEPELLAALLDLESECNLDNTSICEPCWGADCTPYEAPEDDDYTYDTEADDIKPYAATLIALFSIVFLCIIFVAVAVVKGLCPCCPSGEEGGKQQQQPRRAASPKQAGGSAEPAATEFTAVPVSEPPAVAVAPTSGAVRPQIDEPTLAPTQV